MANGAVHTYAYDANGLRTKKVEAGIETEYLLDGPSLFEELDADGATKTGYLTNPQVIDEVLSFEQGSKRYSPVTDALGSIYVVADNVGEVVSTASYDVYGERTVTSAAGAPSLAFGYTGREHEVSGLNYHRDRYVSPALGRWIQPDRMGFVDGPNKYAYAPANPIDAVDTSGGTVTRPQYPRAMIDGLAPTAPIPNEMRLHIAFNQALTARVGYSLYSSLEFSPKTAYFTSGNAGTKGVMGIAVYTPPKSSGCSSRQANVEIRIDFDEIDLVNTWGGSNSTDTIRLFMK
jgi:RHS repeat-associated protein